MTEIHTFNLVTEHRGTKTEKNVFGDEYAE